MIGLERENIRLMCSGQDQYPDACELGDTPREVERDYQSLSNSQRVAVEEILNSRDQIIGLEGAAGSGKTTSLPAIRDATEREGYRVQGFAPTSGAALKLGEAGILANTSTAPSCR